MPSTFDESDFLQSTVDPGGTPLDTKVEFVPEGEYEAEIISLSRRKLEANEKNPTDRYIVEVMWQILDESLKKEMGVENPRARQTIWLDTESDGSFIVGKNKNVATGRLLDALGLNDGRRWSWGMLLHMSGYIRVALPRNEEDSLYSEVRMVGRRQEDVTPRSRRAA